MSRGGGAGSLKENARFMFRIIFCSALLFFNPPAPPQEFVDFDPSFSGFIHVVCIYSILTPFAPPAEREGGGDYWVSPIILMRIIVKPPTPYLIPSIFPNPSLFVDV